MADFPIARDIESDKRDIADAAIVAIERAFRNANLTIEVIDRGPNIHRPLGPIERPLIALAPAALGRRDPQTYHSLPAVAYAWFMFLLTEAFHGKAAWTAIPNAEYATTMGKPGNGRNPWPVNTPEEALGAEVFFAGHRAREAFDRFPSKPHPSGWGMIQHRMDVLEAIRARLHWPRLPDDFVPAPPGQWPNPIAENVREARRRGN